MRHLAVAVRESGRMTVHSEGDKVVLDLGGRVRDVCLGMIEAEELANSLEQYAWCAELAAPELIKGEVWDAKVESYDRKVWLRFWPPVGSTATKVFLPAVVARRMAGMVRFKRQQAAYGMRFVACL